MSNKGLDKFRTLTKLGAGNLAHLDGPLIDHLHNTQKLLRRWGAGPALQRAGLYHAAYGTQGFDKSLFSGDKRQDTVAVIGAKAEEIVYQYCACDRKFFFAGLAEKSNPEFRNRFTGKLYLLKPQAIKDFCELTAANEIEIALGNESFRQLHGAGLRDLFNTMHEHLSEAARKASREIFPD